MGSGQQRCNYEVSRVVRWKEKSDSYKKERAYFLFIRVKTSLSVFVILPVIPIFQREDVAVLFLLSLVSSEVKKWNSLMVTRESCSCSRIRWYWSFRCHPQNLSRPSSQKIGNLSSYQMKECCVSTKRCIPKYRCCGSKIASWFTITMVGC